MWLWLTPAPSCCPCCRLCHPQPRSASWNGAPPRVRVKSSWTLTDLACSSGEAGRHEEWMRARAWWGGGCCTPLLSVSPGKCAWLPQGPAGGCGMGVSLDDGGPVLAFCRPKERRVSEPTQDHTQGPRVENPHFIQHSQAISFHGGPNIKETNKKITPKENKHPTQRCRGQEEPGWHRPHGLRGPRQLPEARRKAWPSHYPTPTWGGGWAPRWRPPGMGRDGPSVPVGIRICRNKIQVKDWLQGQGLPMPPPAPPHLTPLPAPSPGWG